MIKNESRDPNYKVEHDRCVFSMRKSSNPDSKCYGAKNHDTRGGSWKVDGIGHFDNRVEKGGF
ncbi:hypothetical protein HC762_00785 [bacterium]|nr:hypothetical protein [bacterium]